MEMIRFENIYKQFGKLKALDDINLTFNSGECIALIGPNGCGKTTLIKTILGMVVPDSGKMFFQGEQPGRGVSYRNKIGYMPQIGRYPQNMTIGQVVEMITSLREGEIQDTGLMDSYQLRNIFHKRMSTLSGGTIQKVSATLAFLFNPDVLILDEPTAGLDPLAAEILKNKILEARKSNKLILITSHLLSELDDMITELIYMQEGKILFHRNIEDLRKETGEEKVSRLILRNMREAEA